ncbi:MAG: MFS transporter [Paludibacteraceae bacterium]|jgi:predicted MFS family arabinose efflux permease|nr:MFS transporter [Paludibacteraceae bacterium]
MQSDKCLKPNEGIPSSLVALLAVMAGVSVANLYYCQPLLNLIREDTGLTEFQVNLMPVFTQIGYALGLLFIIPMGDLYNRRSTILICFGALFFSLLTIAFSNSVTMLIASFITGVFSVAPQIFIPFVSQFSRKEEKERKVGLVLSGLLVGILGSRVASGYVGDIFGWRTMYGIAAGLIAISVVIVMKTFPYVEPTFNGRFIKLMSSIFRLVKENPKAVTYSVRSGLIFGSLLGMWACMAFRMKEAPFFQGSDMVGLLGLCGIAGALTASNAGKYITRYGVEKVNACGVSLVLLAWIIMGLFQNYYVGIIAGVIIIDIGMQCVQLSNQSATMKLCPQASSRMNTIYMVTYFIGGSFGTFLAGTMWVKFGWYGTVFAGLSMVIASILFTLLRRK